MAPGVTWWGILPTASWQNTSGGTGNLALQKLRRYLPITRRDGYETCMPAAQSRHNSKLVGISQEPVLEECNCVQLCTGCRVKTAESQHQYVRLRMDPKKPVNGRQDGVSELSAPMPRSMPTEPCAIR
jgi:hypothetical protein